MCVKKDPLKNTLKLFFPPTGDAVYLHQQLWGQGKYTMQKKKNLFKAPNLCQANWIIKNWSGAQMFCLACTRCLFLNWTWSSLDTVQLTKHYSSILLYSNTELSYMTTPVLHIQVHTYWYVTSRLIYILNIWAYADCRDDRERGQSQEGRGK